MTRALVLGGGGPVGIAWETGLLAGLAESGVMLAEADYILGTSAGAYVGSQLAMGRDLARMTASIVREADNPRPLASGPPGGADIVKFLADTRLAAADRDPVAGRREVGAFAMKAKTVDEATFFKGLGRSLSELAPDFWPDRPFACTAVDAESGRFMVWDAKSKVGLTRAVASSCSAPGFFPPVAINGRLYIDGGVRTPTNADIPKGHELVIVFAVRVGEEAGPLQAELQSLRDGGARVELIAPDEASVAAFGPNIMDVATRPEVAKAGLAQGRRMAEAIGKIWG
jgi:NTE family protein